MSIRKNFLNSYTDYETQERDIEGNIVDYRYISFGFSLNQAAELVASLTFISPYLGSPFNGGAGCSIDGVQTACGIALLAANSEVARAVQISDTAYHFPMLNLFGSDVIFHASIVDEIEVEKFDPLSGDLIGYGYLPIFRADIRSLGQQGGQSAQPVTLEYRRKLKDAFRDLGSGCKKHFDVEDAKKVSALNKWIDQNLDFVDISDTAPVATAVGLNPATEFVKKFFPNITRPTILIGGAFKDPSKAPDRLPNEGGPAYQRNTLIHEYSHARYGFNHTELFKSWRLDLKGYKIAGNTTEAQEESARQAVNKFIANDCGPPKS